MAGRPLRPATDHRHGRPLPHRLANRPQAPPKASPKTLSSPTLRLVTSCGITRCFHRLSPTPGQVAHVFRTRPPRKQPESCPARLACIRHAASVDPEPGSNSPPLLLLLFACLWLTGVHTPQTIPKNDRRMWSITPKSDRRVVDHDTITVNADMCLERKQTTCLRSSRRALRPSRSAEPCSPLAPSSAYAIQTPD